MNFSLSIFIDSDVIISSLISEKGAAHFLIYETKLNFHISNISHPEVIKVIKRLDLNLKEFNRVVQEKFKVVKLLEDLKEVEREYSVFALDPNDAHVVAGAKKAKAKFLISYNLKHFRTEKIKNELQILTFTPAQFLQYLRSL